MMNSPVTPAFASMAFVSPLSGDPGNDELVFSKHSELLDFVTRNWRSDFVTVDLTAQSLLERFATRPFFMVVSVDAPILVRYNRSLRLAVVSYHALYRLN